MTGASPHVHHVGLVVPSERQAQRLMGLLGLEEAHRGFVEQYSATCVFTVANGGSPIEFVIPDGGVLSEFNRGIGGLHHVAVTVDDLRESARSLSEQGIDLLEAEPVRGAGQFLCNFLPPGYTRGVIVELIQEIPEAQ
jgi:catechol 2,3-dioxygenase-like lactoylglutathione lyase family enzyme